MKRVTFGASLNPKWWSNMNILRLMKNNTCNIFEDQISGPNNGINAPILKKKCNVFKNYYCII